MFVGHKTTVQLQLTTPLDSCCNCGAKGEVDLVETPLQRTRYFLFFGTELELQETFPYCKRCRRSAKRVRLGWFSKFMVACVVAAALFLALVLTADALPRTIQDSPFYWSLFLGMALTLAYFYLREWQKSDRTYYQPVSLVDVTLSGDQLQHLHLRFANETYAWLFTKANPELVAAKVLQVETAK